MGVAMHGDIDTDKIDEATLALAAGPAQRVRCGLEEHLDRTVRRHQNTVQKTTRRL
jgi:hypothetical protein